MNLTSMLSKYARRLVELAQTITSQKITDWDSAKTHADSQHFSGEYGDLANVPAITTDLASLTDVELSGLADGQALTYESSSAIWKPKTLEGVKDLTAEFVANGHNEATSGSPYPLGFSVLKAGADGVNWDRNGMVLSYKLPTIISQTLFDGETTFHRREIPYDNSPYDDFLEADNNGSYDIPLSSKWSIINTGAGQIANVNKIKGQLELTMINSNINTNILVRGKWSIQNLIPWELEVKISEMFQFDIFGGNPQHFTISLQNAAAPTNTLVIPYLDWVYSGSKGGFSGTGYSWADLAFTNNLGAEPHTGGRMNQPFTIKLVGDGTGKIQLYKKRDSQSTWTAFGSQLTSLQSYSELNLKFMMSMGPNGGKNTGSYTGIDYVKFNSGQVRIDSTGTLVDATQDVIWTDWKDAFSGDYTDLTNQPTLFTPDLTTVAPQPGDTLVWDGTNWIPGEASGGGSGIVVSDTEPVDPEPNTIWLDTSA